MDLINELKEIEDNNLSIENLIENLEEEQIKLGKKIYILKVINLSRAMIQLIQSDIPKDKLLGINLAYHQDGDNYQFSIHLFYYQEKRLKMDSKFREKSKNFAELLKKTKNINNI